MNEISPRMPYEKSSVEVNGQAMAYAEHGAGDPIVFLHGNATSSYMWRNIMPHMPAIRPAPGAREVAGKHTDDAAKILPEGSG